MPKINLEAMGTMAAAGFTLIPLRGKAPIDKGWTTRDYTNGDTLKFAANTGCNLGVRLTDEQLVVDVDPRNGGTESLAKLSDAIGVNLADWTPSTKTGSGGLHLWMRKPAGLTVKGSLADFPGIDLKTVGGQVVAPGSIHPDTGQLYVLDDPFDDLTDLAELPSELSDLIGRSSAKAKAPEKPKARSGASGDSQDRLWGAYSTDQLAKMLAQLNPEDFQAYEANGEGWLDLAMSCHHATAGEGLAEFLDWSQRDSTYADDEHEAQIKEHWGSFASDRRGGTYTARNLISVLQKRGLDWEAGENEDAGDGAADDFAEPDDSLEAHDVEDGDTANVAKTDRPPTAKEEAAYLESEGLTKDPLQEFFAEWVFVADSMQFIRRIDHKRFKVEQFNAMYGDIAKGNPSTEVIKGRTPCKKYESLVFIPGKPEVVGKGRKASYNLWRPSAAKPVQGDVSILEAHLKLLLPNAFERDLLLDYLHFVVCKPEVKIMFALLLQGAHGTGKSLLGSLAGRAVGHSNIVRPSNKEVTSQWTAWQEGSSLAIIEELMTNGRLEVANSLKTVITDETLRIEDKGKPLYSIPNHLNLLCFTNHKNAVRLEEGDRRWLVMFSPMVKQAPEYYAKLWDWANRPEAPGVFLHWLSQRVPKLDPKSVAPHTAAKDRMMEASLTDVEASVKELFESGAFPFTHELVRYDDVRDKIPGQRPHHSSVSRAMESLGMVRHTRNTNTADGLPTIQLWSTANHDGWKTTGPVERVKAYLTMRGMTAEDFADIYINR